jgi:hypothetical protein
LGSNHKPQLPLSVLDPTCGSGAFLFAALNILQPLYEASLMKMQQFVTDADQLAPITVDDEVAALIALGESSRLEFKSTARMDVKTAEALAGKPEGQRLEILKTKDKERQHDILKAVSALLNTSGGDVLIGVDDEGKGFGVHHDYIFLGSEAKRNRDIFELWMNQLFIHQFGKVAAGCIEPVMTDEEAGLPATLESVLGQSVPPEQVSRSRSTTKIWSLTGFSPSNRSRKSSWWNQLTQTRYPFISPARCSTNVPVQTPTSGTPIAAARSRKPTVSGCRFSISSKFLRG